MSAPKREVQAAKDSEDHILLLREILREQQRSNFFLLKLCHFKGAIAREHDPTQMQVLDSDGMTIIRWPDFKDLV